jgi:AraC family transcriptional regulator
METTAASNPASKPILAPPRFEDRKSFLLAGITERYNNRHIEGIPAQWQRFAPHIGQTAGRVGATTYGVCLNFDGAGNFDYMCGFEISEGSPIPEALTLLTVAEQHYAVFSHRDHISKIGKTWNAIYNEWPPASGRTLLPAPQFEAYGEDFDARTGTGVVEIWMPIER